MSICPYAPRKVTVILSIEILLLYLYFIIEIKIRFLTEFSIILFQFIDTICVHNSRILQIVFGQN